MQDQHQNHATNTHHLSMQMEKSPLEHQIGDDDWISKKFNSTPFIIYKLWLVVNFGFVFIPQCSLLYLFRGVYTNKKLTNEQMLYISVHASSILLLYGYGEMLFAMTRRKSSAAQRSFLKFQYYLIGAVIYHPFFLKMTNVKIDISHFLMGLSLVIPPIVHLIGAHAVLKVFRGNHPLRRQTKYGSLEASNLLETDFLEQNEAISSEISRYEQKLNTWPYLVYNWWLKLVVIFEFCVIFGCIFSLIMIELFKPKFSLHLLLCIGALFLSFFNAYSRFEMEAAMRTRVLARSQRAVGLLKISVVSSILSYIFVALKVDASTLEQLQILIPTFRWGIVFAAIPVLCLVGAVKVHKLIEERDHFTKVSSFTEDTFLYF